jgi:hypothetical protein
MLTDLVEVSVHILKRIYNSEKESLHKSEIDEIAEEMDSNKILSLLLSLDLIETETDPDIYFLTPETYELIRTGEIEEYIWSQVEPKEDEEVNETKDPRDFVLFPPEEDVPRFKFKDYAIYVLIVLALIIAYFVRKEINENKDKKTKEEIIKNLDNLKVIDENGDTIRVFQ